MLIKLRRLPTTKNDPMKKYPIQDRHNSLPRKRSSGLAGRLAVVGALDDKFHMLLANWYEWDGLGIPWNLMHLMRKL